ncbi:MAG TPA: hypothetical protein VFE60_00350 [Roseiarcus sp.]|jgi:hypothetical protein|nr:hypothetical protein [Roseiarcus sp.]
MQLENKDWVIGIIVAVLLAAVAIFEDNTFLANAILIFFGPIISYFLVIRGDVIRTVRVLLLIGIWILIIGTGYYIYTRNFERDMRSYYGYIYPSNVNMPDKRCGPGDDIGLYPGANNFQMTRFPYTFLSIDGDPIIALSKVGDAISIDYLMLYDTNGDNIVRIDKNEFWIKSSVQRFMTPNRSQLAIADHTGSVALALNFLNKKHLAIDGKFFYHGFTVEIGKLGIDITFPNGKHLGSINDDCFYGHELFISASGVDAVSPMEGATNLKIKVH